MGDRHERLDPATAMLGEPLRMHAANTLMQAVQFLGWRGARLHAGVHQARKALRHTRAVLALGASTLGPDGVAIDRQLRRVNRSLSSLRDAQALVETLDRLTKKHTAPATGPLLDRARRAATRRRGTQARLALHDDAGFADRRAALAALAAELQALPWQDLREKDALRSLQHSESKAAAAAKRARRSMHDNDWHRWRRRARRVLQQRRALVELSALQKSGIDRDKAMTTLLGEAQDYALLLDHCGDGSPFAEPDRKALQALAKTGVRRTRARIVQRRLG
ncbi:MAG: CHAD domain-containing protein [Xanthomonadaceae bacterium]|nr:CHAD domain-containing protein [Xanthomonadaceae bacterium]